MEQFVIGCYTKASCDSLKVQQTIIFNMRFYPYPSVLHNWLCDGQWYAGKEILINMSKWIIWIRKEIYQSSVKLCVHI